MTNKQKETILKGMRKKDNLAYWDEIDDMVERFIIDLAKSSYAKIKLYQEEYDDDEFSWDDYDESECVPSEEITWLAADVRDLAVKLLEQDLGAWFPYVDENY